MSTALAVSTDGTRIAYDVTGNGPALVLLHGGGHTRRNWHETGYVKQLQDRFKVIAIDIRGSGESDKSTDPALYTTDRMCQDVLAVADACGVERFTLWGFSYGANIGRYLATQSDRFEKLVIMDVPFGLGASGDFRVFIEGFCHHWAPIVQAQAEGTLEPTTLSTEDQETLRGTNIAVDLARFGAILDWGVIEPADLRCQALWVVGSKNETTMESIKEYEERLPDSKVRVVVVEGLTHFQVFTEIDRTLPLMAAFTSEQVV